MIAVDASVVVASFGAWHEHHEAALAALAQRPSLPAHVALESYSVLTRLPDPFRADAATVVEFLARTFTGSRLRLDDQAGADLPRRLAVLAITGGAVYDALIAFTAQAAAAEILTLDRRALDVYGRCGAAARLLI